MKRIIGFSSKRATVAEFPKHKNPCPRVESTASVSMNRFCRCVSPAFHVKCGDKKEILSGIRAATTTQAKESFCQSLHLKSLAVKTCTSVEKFETNTPMRRSNGSDDRHALFCCYIQRFGAVHTFVNKNGRAGHPEWIVGNAELNQPVRKRFA